MPLMMKCARNFTLRSTSGHILHFQADEPRLVPDACVDEALSVNIIPVEGNAPESDGPAPKTLRINAMSRELREALLLHSIDELYREGNAKDFDGGARPKTNAISERAGLDVTATERSKLWDKYRDLKANNTELPRPRNFNLVVDAQRLNTSRDLIAYGETLGLDPATLKGHTLKEIKSMVITAAIEHREIKFTEATLDEA
jgi:hypothetical protein